MSNDEWVTGQIAALRVGPNPQADVLKGFERLRVHDERARAGRRRWTAASVAAGLASLAFLVAPQGRLIAQRLWQGLSLRQVSVVRVNFDDLNLQSFDAEDVGGPVAQRVVADAREAAAVAGFLPGIPTADVIAERPGLSVISQMAFRFVLNRGELTSALFGAGITDLDVPAAWEGAAISVQVGPIVEVDYPNADMQLLESQPFTLVTPPAFDTARLVEVAFRLLHVDHAAAHQMGQTFSTTPSLLLGIPQDEEATIEPVSVGNGRGLYVEEFDDNGRLERTTVIWSATDRILALSSSLDRQRALAIADSIK